MTNISKIQSESNSQLPGADALFLDGCDQYFKDTIWKQFTTVPAWLYSLLMLWPIFQRYNLKAIHNRIWAIFSLSLAVTNISKIQSESNSQLFASNLFIRFSCDQYFKDTIWKQFTTRPLRVRACDVLWPIFQRYNLKAIHNYNWEKDSWAVLWPIFQRYNLKAIHNYLNHGLNVQNAVTNISKIQSESNSQQHWLYLFVNLRCDQYFKDTIWKQFTTANNFLSSLSKLWPIFQRYNLKAIHNFWNGWSKLLGAVTNISKIQSESNSQLLKSWFERSKAVTNISKIQSESNSQPLCRAGYPLGRCDQYFKDTIWKQFTTLCHCYKIQLGLWPIFQRYNLKAIHNKLDSIHSQRGAVTNISKIQSESNSQLAKTYRLCNRRCDQYFKDTIWKQFTTIRVEKRSAYVLWPIFQRYNLKAIHNTCKFRVLHFFAVTNISKIQSESNSQHQK